MCVVPKRCNDMMNVGRLQGFDVRRISLTLFAKVCDCVGGKLNSQPLTVVQYIHKSAGSPQAVHKRFFSHIKTNQTKYDFLSFCGKSLDV